MSQFESSITWSATFGGENKKPTIILLSAPFILTTFRYFGSPTFYQSALADHFLRFGNPDLTAALYMFASSLLLLGILPALIVRFVFHESLSLYGVSWGDLQFGLKAAFFLAPLMILLTIPASTMPSFTAQYPIFKGVGSSTSTFVGYSLAYSIFYAGWEFYFRGYMQFGLRERFGDWNSILMQTLASCLLHIGKPALEIYGAIIAGIVWGWVVFRSRSILVILLLHWLMGVSLDFFITHF